MHLGGSAMSNEEQVSPWIVEWQTKGTPEWATLLQSGKRVAKMVDNWFSEHATFEERVEKAKYGVSETFDAAIEAKFPGAIARMNAVLAESTRLRSFDKTTKEDYMVKNSADNVAYRVLWDANDRTTAIKGNEIFGKPIFEVPEVTESADDTPETSAPTSYRKGG